MNRQMRDVGCLSLIEFEPETIRLVGRPFCYKERGRRRFVIWIIHRRDGQVKLFDFGCRILDQFSAYKMVKQRDPGGEEGPDWQITYQWPEIWKNGQLIGRGVTRLWMIIPDKPAPFTPEERLKIREISSKYPLADLCSPSHANRMTP